MRIYKFIYFIKYLLLSIDWTVLSFMNKAVRIIHYLWYLVKKMIGRQEKHMAGK